MGLKKFMINYSEPLLWSAALLALFFMDGGASHLSLCPLKALGFDRCPGCGIGHSIHYALHFNFEAALREHVLGIPATLIIIYQIIKSLPTQTKNLKLWTNNKY